MPVVEVPQTAKLDSAERARRITAALGEGARTALLRHKREDHPIFVWRDGQVVEIPPEEIVIPPAAK